MWKFGSMNTGRVLFVWHLPDGWPGKSATHRFEIQLVDRHGRATAWAVVSELENSLKVGDVDVPRAVIEAARGQRLGEGDFVDEIGNQVNPKDLGDYITEPCPDAEDEGRWD